MKYIISNILLLLIVVQPCLGQKIKKPELVVYGSDFLAFSVAVQSAKSGVSTIWLVDGDRLMSEFSVGRVELSTIPRMDSGIWMDVLMEMALAKSPNDSLAAIVKQDMSPRLFQNAVEKILKELPELTVMKGEKILSIKRRRRDWEVQISSKHRYRVRSIVDASQNQQLSTLAGLVWSDNLTSIQKLETLTLQQLRTSVAVGELDNTLYSVLLENVLAGEKDGFFNFRGLCEIVNDDISLTPFRAAAGQAVGATAAYLAFFKTSADKIDVRTLQTELMTYGARILPFQDVAVADPHFYALQRFGLATVLPSLHTEKGFLFQNEERISFNEIEPVFDHLYSRAQLWFLDNKGDYFQWKDFLSLIKFVGLRGDDIDKQIGKEWASKLGFEGSFDPDAFVNRYQFAVIVDMYANPYVKAVNQQGEFIN